MKTETKSITPADAGLSLVICSGPRGSVRDDWPNIEYTCQLTHRRTVVWTGEYRLGVGHVKVPKGIRFTLQCRLTSDEESLLMTWQSKPHAQFVNKQLHADVAAKLATAQKVAPTLDSVCASLLVDGSAFFDGSRFEDWAADFGYSDDSIKAKETFEECDKIGRALSRAISRDDLAGLREWAAQQ